MPKPFNPMTVAQFLTAVSKFNWTVTKTEVHVHCTDTPNHKDFRQKGGLACVEGMHGFHTRPKSQGGRGWSDIAQHVSIDPDGIIWTGRAWNRSPASALGHNGSHVFMFEMIGLFDTGKDPFGGAQEQAAYHVTAAVLDHFGVSATDGVKFHNQFTSGKTCPDSALKRPDFVANVKDVMDGGISSMAMDLPPAAEAAPDRPEFLKSVDSLLEELDQREDDGVIDDGELDHTLIPTS